MELVRVGRTKVYRWKTTGHITSRRAFTVRWWHLLVAGIILFGLQLPISELAGLWDISWIIIGR
jgi:hypothetical protein